jgi:cytochrome c-type biogenesis protein CcmH
MEAGTFWIAAAFMALAVLAVLAAALRFGARQAAGEGGEDQRVYRHQLQEIDRDRARGVIAADEAERLRAEVARRLLEADRAERPQVSSPLSGRWPALALMVLAVAGAALLYARIGAPGYPDLPLADRLAMAEANYEARPSQDAAEAAAPKPEAPSDIDPTYLEMMDKLRAAVAARPGDVQGLTLLASNEAALGNFSAARAAQQGLVAALGDKASAEDHAALAEAMILAAGGVITKEAEAELVATLNLDPSHGPARYYSGLMFAQTGRPDRTFALWQPLLEQSAPDDPWVAPIRAQLPGVAAAAGVKYELPEGPGPDAEDIAAAEEMSAEDRQAMIAGMVEQLSVRLEAEGGPVEDWAKLVTSLAVLKDSRAAEVLANAREKFAGDAAALAVLDGAADAAGLAP